LKPVFKTLQNKNKTDNYRLSQKQSIFAGEMFDDV